MTARENTEEKNKAGRRQRLRRSDPERDGPNRSARDHIRRHMTPNGNGGNGQPPASAASDTVQQAIGEMVRLSSTVIEEQIRAGQTAAERLRVGRGNARQPSPDLNAMIEGLIATTKEVGTMWVELLSNALRSTGTAAPSPAAPNGADDGNLRTTRKTCTGTSSGAITISHITPLDPASRAVPPEIVVTGSGVKKVVLNLQPPTTGFIPVVRTLLAGDPGQSLSDVKFALSAEGGVLVLSVNVPRRQAAGTYAGIIVDGTTNEPGGMISVTVGS